MYLYENGVWVRFATIPNAGELQESILPTRNSTAMVFGIFGIDKQIIGSSPLVQSLIPLKSSKSLGARV